jgi:hypothetical protein
MIGYREGLLPTSIRTYAKTRFLNEIPSFAVVHREKTGFFGRGA